MANDNQSIQKSKKKSNRNSFQQTISDLKKKHRDMNKKMKKIGINKTCFEESKEEAPKKPKKKMKIQINVNVNKKPSEEEEKEEIFQKEPKKKKKKKKNKSSTTKH